MGKVENVSRKLPAGNSKDRGIHHLGWLISKARGGFSESDVYSAMAVAEVAMCFVVAAVAMAGC